MKAAFITTSPPHDRFAWSGINYSMQQAFRQAGWEIHPIGDLKTPFKPLFRFRRYLNRLLFSQQYLLTREPVILRSYARQVSQALKNLDVDFVFSPGTIPIAYLETDLPIFFWTDAVFAAMVDYYPQYSSLHPASVRYGNAMEQNALDRARLAIYSSGWAARSAEQYYSVDPSKIQTVPLGINISPDLTREQLRGILKTRAEGPVRLLFSGIDWDRKGGDIAVRTAEILHESGIEVELHIVGPVLKEPVPEYVFVHGFLNRFDRGHMQKLDTLFRVSHFLILPTRAECAAIVLAEASAYGVPGLTTDVGGNATIIKEGVNGYLFPQGSLPDAYASRIQKLLSDRKAYEKNALSALEEYKSRLNWGESVKTVTDLIRQNLQ
jgi:glycosyltransferase involved in cell wall biosynthesis